MSAPDLELRTRAALESLAATITPAKPPLDDLLARRAIRIARPARRTVAWRAVAGGAAAAVATVAAIVMLTRDPAGAPRPTGPVVTEQSAAVSSAPSTAAPDTTSADSTSSTTASTPLPPAPVTTARRTIAPGVAGIAYGFDRVWLAGTEREVLAVFDPSTLEELAAVPLSAGVTHTVAGVDAIYACGRAGTVRIDPLTTTITARSDLPCDGLAASGEVWTVDGDADEVRRLDPDTLAVDATIEVPTDGAAIAAGDARIWVSGDGSGVHVIDPVSDAVTGSVRSDHPVLSIAVIDETAWATLSGPEAAFGTSLARASGAEFKVVQASMGASTGTVLASGRNLAVRGPRGELMFVDTTSDRSTLWHDSLAPSSGPGDLVIRPTGLAVAWNGRQVWNVVSGAAGPELVAIDPGPFEPEQSGDQPHMVASIPTATGRGRLLSAFGRLWQAGTSDNTLIAVDPGSRQVISTFEGMPGPYLTAGDDSIYVCGSGRTVRIDPSTGATLASSTRGCYVSIAYGGGSVWVAGGTGIVRLDAVTLEPQATIPDVTAQWGIAYAFDAVWVGDGLGRDGNGGGHVTRIDPASNAVVAVIPTPGMSRLFTATDDSLWVTMWARQPGGVSLARIDPNTNAVTATIAGAETTEVVAVGDVLITSSYGGLITIVDQAELQVLARFNPHASGSLNDRTAIAWDGSRLWQRIPHADYEFHGALIAIDLGRYAPG